MPRKYYLSEIPVPAAILPQTSRLPIDEWEGSCCAGHLCEQVARPELVPNSKTYLLSIQGVGFNKHVGFVHGT